MNDFLVPDQSHPNFPVNLRPNWAVKAADHLLKMVETKPMWEVIDFVLKVWKEKEERVKDFEADREMVKETRANEFASSKTKSIRYMAEVPAEIMDVLDMFYTREIGEMGKKKFWNEFCKRYPYFKMADKL